MSLKVLGPWKNTSSKTVTHWLRAKLSYNPHCYYPEIWMSIGKGQSGIWYVNTGVKENAKFQSVEHAKQILDADAIEKGWYLL